MLTTHLALRVSGEARGSAGHRLDGSLVEECGGKSPVSPKFHPGEQTGLGVGSRRLSRRIVRYTFLCCLLFLPMRTCGRTWPGSIIIMFVVSALPPVLFAALCEHLASPLLSVHAVCVERALFKKEL